MLGIGNLLKATFTKDKIPLRAQITHPKQLQLGDIIELALLPQTMLSQARLEVTKVSAYDFSGELNPCFTLRGKGHKNIYLSRRPCEYPTLHHRR